MKFRTALIDPPWQYGSPGWKGGADKEYGTLPGEALQEMPVNDILTDDAHLWMWTTDTHNELAVSLAEGWGFKKKGTWKWVKLTKNPLNLGTKKDRERLNKARREGEPVIEHNGEFYLLAWGNGYYGRSVWESLILFTRGRNLVGPKHSARQTRKAFHLPLQEHSAKPKETLEFVRDYSPKDRIELFARDVFPGFYSWGNEVTDFTHPALDEWSEWARTNYQTTTNR